MAEEEHSGKASVVELGLVEKKRLCYEAADVSTEAGLVSKLLPRLRRNVSMSTLAVSGIGKCWTLSQRDEKLLVENCWKVKGAFFSFRSQLSLTKTCEEVFTTANDRCHF